MIGLSGEIPLVSHSDVTSPFPPSGNGGYASNRDVLPLRKMREACNFHHRYTSTMRDKIRKKNPENHIVGFLKNLFANYGGK